MYKLKLICDVETGNGLLYIYHWGHAHTKKTTTIHKVHMVVVDWCTNLLTVDNGCHGSCFKSQHGEFFGSLKTTSQ
jgi:hypothetical protein